MDDPGIQEAVEALEADEIEAIERFVRRLCEEGRLRPAVAERWRAAIERAPRRRPLRHAQG
jgi:hypothetical protein